MRAPAAGVRRLGETLWKQLVKTYNDENGSAGAGRTGPGIPPTEQRQAGVAARQLAQFGVLGPWRTNQIAAGVEARRSQERTDVVAGLQMAVQIAHRLGAQRLGQGLELAPHVAGQAGQDPPSVEAEDVVEHAPSGSPFLSRIVWMRLRGQARGHGRFRRSTATPGPVFLGGDRPLH